MSELEMRLVTIPPRGSAALDPSAVFAGSARQPGAIKARPEGIVIHPVPRPGTPVRAAGRFRFTVRHPAAGAA